MRPHRWTAKDDEAPKPAPVAHYPGVRPWSGRWQGFCSCGFFGQPRDEWPDANTEAAAHVFAVRGRA